MKDAQAHEWLTGILRGHHASRTYQAHGLTITVKVSPCSWLYPNYGFQFEYTAKDGHSHGFLHRKELPEEQATSADVQDMLDTMLKPEPCDKCQHTHLFNAASNRKRKCERCLMEQSNKQSAKLTKQWHKELAQKDKRAKKLGYKYKVEAWVHPEKGGDDYLYYEYFKFKPTDSDIKQILKKEGRHGPYKISVLDKETQA